MTLVALDLFAGTGWGVACRSLGIEEHGVDNMPEVIATRAANGMSTIFKDVWEGLDGRAIVPEHHLQIASPPCQSFSMAGRGAGRQALIDVLGLIQEGVYRRPLELETVSAKRGLDDRTALVLAPLAYAVAHQPYYIAWEQVPPVLPVWEACAEVLRAEGYSVWTGYLQAEQYGVPQTRKRAILMASLLGEAKPPVPTHSKFYSKTPERFDEGVLPWVSMAEALGWGMTSRPYPTVATGSTTAGGGSDPAALGGSGARKLVYAERSEGRWEASGDADNDGGTLRLAPEEAATLQSYPTEVQGWGLTNRPAPTVTRHGLMTRSATGTRSVIVEAIEQDEFIFRPPFTRETAEVEGFEPREDGYASLSGRYELDAVNFSPEEAAALQFYPPYFDQAVLEQQVRERVNDQSGTPYDAAWPAKRPALTIAGRDLVPHPGATANRFNGSTKSRNDGIKIEAEEAATLQSYGKPFTWKGGRSKQFLMIGNAVPPLLARAVLAALLEG